MNLKNLAKTLGLSETTVSRALNGYPEVNEKTRERVIAAARATGYQPNPSARNLAIGRTNVIGIVYPLDPADFGDRMFLNTVAGMSDALAAKGMDLIIAPASTGNSLLAYKQLVHGRRVDGFVVSRTCQHDERIAYLLKSGMPFIAHGQTNTSQPYAWFDYDNKAGIRLAMEHLLSVGHRRIGMISAPLELNFAQQRRDSFLDAMLEAGAVVDPRHLKDGALDRRTGYQSMHHILASPARPTAVIIDNHLSGIGALRAMRDAGVAIGRDISIIVWGSTEDSLVDMRVTTIDQPHLGRAGMRMIEMLLALLDGTPPSDLHEMWQPVLLPGDTVAPPAD